MKKSNILAHRGLWKDLNLSKNSKTALFKALEEGFGIETDIRDGLSNIEVRHDPFARGWNFEDLLCEYNLKGYKSLLALNIKSDGLGKKLIYLLQKYEIENYFVFDMSFPDHVEVDRAKIKNLVRISEYENNFQLFHNSVGYWIDSFKKNNLYGLELKNLCRNELILTYVSPELHGYLLDKEFKNFIKRKTKILSSHSVMVCTDSPYFYIE